MRQVTKEGRVMDSEGSRRAVALTDTQGTACLETALYGDHDTPQNRAEVERRFCRSSENGADPVAGTWCDVSENDAFFDD